MAQAKYDLFVSYNRQDADTVLSIRAKLEMRGIRTFIDRENLISGLPWPQALEQALQSSRAIAVVLGPHDFGVWQKREMFFALDLQAEAERENHLLPVIPILLKDANPHPGFLFLNSWVDFRSGEINAESLETLVRAIQQDDRRSQAGRPEICPYVGLRAFREEDQAFYFGREAFANALVKKVSGNRVVAVVGPSGSGKSSAVLAGLLPRLRRQRAPSWDAISFTPGDNPWWRLAYSLIPLLERDPSETKRIELAGALAGALLERNGALAGAFTRALERSGGTDRLLVVVDQFEELFTLAPRFENLMDEKAKREAEEQKQRRSWFLDDLLSSTKAAPVTVLITLRADYYGHALDANSELCDVLNTGQVALGQMSEDELRDSIVGPARLAGIEFEPLLVDRLLKDVREQPGCLPLLEYSLTRLWEKRHGARLASVDYPLDGLAGAIGSSADSVYAHLSEPEKRATRALFGRLVRVSPADAEGADTRQRATRSEIGEIGWQVALKLAGPGIRLLVLGRDTQSKEETAEVAHEALVRNWSQLRRWLHEDRDFLIWRQQFEVFKAIWEDSGRNAAFLSGSVLDDALRWQTVQLNGMNEGEREFIALSDRVRRSNQRQTTAVRIAVYAALAGLIVAMGWFSYTRTHAYQIRSILNVNLEDRAFSAAMPPRKVEHTSLYSFVALITLGRTNELKAAALRVRGSDDRPVRLALLGASLASVGQLNEARALFQQAEDLLKSSKPPSSERAGLRIARIYYDSGRVGEARDLMLRVQSQDLTDAAQLWTLLGNPDHGAALLKEATNTLKSGNVSEIIGVAEGYAMAGDKTTALDLLKFGLDNIRNIKDFDAQESGFGDIAEALAGYGETEAALRSASPENIHDGIKRASALTSICQAFARMGNTERALKLAPEIEKGHEEPSECMTAITRNLASVGQTKKALDIAHNSTYKELQSDMLLSMVEQLARAGQPDEARGLLMEMPTPDRSQKSRAATAVAVALRKKGRDIDANTILSEARRLADELDRDNLERDVALLPVCDMYADMGRYREARLIAESMRNAYRQSYAYQNILNAYAGKKNPKLGISVETLLENSPDRP